jgi:glycosyltransferase involved in cell wall biosynthesis
LVMAGRLRALAIPIAGYGVASARLRLYALLHELDHAIAADVLPPRDAYALERADPLAYEVIYVQKEASPAVVKFCERAARAGTPIVYDIDDDFGCWRGMDEATLCRMASTVTVDSPARAAALRSETSAPVQVVPCMIDLASDPRRGEDRHVVPELSTVGTFGNLESVTATVPYLDRVPPPVRKIAIGPAGMASVFGDAELVLFDTTTFVRELLRAEIFLLAHTDDESARKDNNRLVMAMSLGIPAITSPTPSYVDTLVAAGFPWMVCSSPDDVPALLERLRPASLRVEIGATLRGWAWRNYAPSVVAGMFLEVLRATVERSRCVYR